MIDTQTYRKKTPKTCFILQCCLSIAWILSTVLAYGQGATIKQQSLSEVTISTYHLQGIRQSSLNIESIKTDSIAQYGNYNLSSVLAQTPGVSMLSTGIGIAKPVIRGLYGNRVLILLAGLKFDNQQWQEEHGLGLSTMGLSRVELIKGPMGILYGSEAIGGVINLIEEEPTAAQTKQMDIGLSFNSNTLGGNMQMGYKAATKNKHWSVRLGLENNGDYSDGHNNRVLNSRFDGYALKTSFGFERKNWHSNNYFSSSFKRFGFIFNDVYTFITPDKRWSRKLNENPAHLVLLNVLSSENKIRINQRSDLSINFGVQSNKRMENEGGGAISLNMHLLTLQYLMRYEYRINAQHKLIFSNLNSIEDNTNYGSRKIVPDALMQESNLSAYWENSLSSKLILENGIGFGEKTIHTYFTPSVNSQDKEIQSFKKTAPYYNFFSGASYVANKHLDFKFNLATGVRIANLAELSSDGLHEGIFTYEIGNPALKNEQVFSGNMLVNIRHSMATLSISPFYNYFLNYIYLAPTNEQWFGFPVYRYLQQNARQYGTEVSLKLQLPAQLKLQSSYAGMMSKTEDGQFTPYLPAQKISSTLYYCANSHHRIPLELELSWVYNLKQSHTAPYEIQTPQYQLWQTGISTNFSHRNQTYQLSFAVNNLFNIAYYDHLSRFKNFGLLNQGRNAFINFKIIL